MKKKTTKEIANPFPIIRMGKKLKTDSKLRSNLSISRMQKLRETKEKTDFLSI